MSVVRTGSAVVAATAVVAHSSAAATQFDSPVMRILVGLVLGRSYESRNTDVATHPDGRAGRS